MVMRDYVKKEDRVGQEFGRLTVESVYKDKGRSYAKCKCSCGACITTRIDALQSGMTVSCGCYMKERLSETHTKHGMSATRTYGCWEAMKARCDYKGNPSYDDYGGAGITYQESWGNFENFITDMGVCPDGFSLDRIDGTKGYTPDNCRWASATTQARNQKKRKCGFYSKYVGVGFDKRAKTGGWYFKMYKNRKFVSKYCLSEIQAAAYYDYCSKLVYSEQVTLNNTNYILNEDEKTMLNNLTAIRFPEILNKE
jgi:hypothetical protein